MYGSHLLLKYPFKLVRKLLLVLSIALTQHLRTDLDIFTTTLHGISDKINMEHKLELLWETDMNVDLIKYFTHEATDTYVDGIFSSGFISRFFKADKNRSYIGHTASSHYHK